VVRRDLERQQLVRLVVVGLQLVGFLVVRLVVVGLQLVGFLVVRQQLVRLVLVGLLVVRQQLVRLVLVGLELVDCRLELAQLRRRVRPSRGQIRLVDVTPGPFLVAFDRPHDRMTSLVVMTASVFPRGTVAAADRATGETHPQLNSARTVPLAAGACDC
jgi:hypothetical protein